MLRLVAGKVRLARCVACGTSTIRPGFILADGDHLLGRICFICLAAGPQVTARRMAAYAASLLEVAARLALLAEPVSPARAALADRSFAVAGVRGPSPRQWHMAFP